MTEPIVIERRVQAPAATVYQYLTESDKWAAWQGVAAAIEAHAGGRFGMTMPNDMQAAGEFLELVPNTRVVFTWGWVGHPGLPPGSSVVEISLLEDDDGTTIRLEHRELPTDEVQIHVVGWNHYIPRLAAVAEGRDIELDPGPG